jgi:hypothetical protein
MSKSKLVRKMHTRRRSPAPKKKIQKNKRKEVREGSKSLNIYNI